MGVISKEDPLWKQRYERFKSFLDDIECEIRNEEFEKCETRAWDAPKTIYVSFCFDVCDCEKHAKENFGEGNYDVYELKIKSPKG